MIKEFFKQLLFGSGLALGVLLAFYVFAFVFNSVEKLMLSQNCDKYFEVLYEQNLVPHRCFLELEEHHD